MDPSDRELGLAHLAGGVAGKWQAAALRSGMKLTGEQAFPGDEGVHDEERRDELKTMV